jgi:hypothetical protein
MYKLLHYPGRTFTLEELIDRTQTVRESIFDKQTRALPVSSINLNPVVDPDELDFLAGLVPFHHISNKLLFKLVRVATGFEVHDRWVAVRAVIAKRIPIPVPKPLPKGDTAESGLQSQSPCQWQEAPENFISTYNVQVD